MWTLQNESCSRDSFWDFKGKDELVDQWWLMPTPIPVLFITALYFSFVLKIGPKYMEKRPSMGLNNVLLIYNVVQMLFSVYMFCRGMQVLTVQGLIHSKCDLERKMTKEISSGIHLYLVAKITELLDTVFFVLRKKWNQITFLHLYHHSSMILVAWVFLKYNPTMAIMFLGTVNCFVHIVMYGYYALSAVPSLTKYLWWKKYITSLQLVQFASVIVHALLNYKYSGCPISNLTLAVILLHSSVFFYLFGDFYVKSYLKQQKLKRETEIKKNHVENNALATEQSQEIYKKKLYAGRLMPGRRKYLMG